MAESGLCRSPCLAAPSGFKPAAGAALLRSPWRMRWESNPMPSDGTTRFPNGGRLSLLVTSVTQLVRAEGFEHVTVCVLSAAPPTVGLSAHGAAGRIRTDALPGLSWSPLPLGYSRSWSPV